MKNVIQWTIERLRTRKSVLQRGLRQSYSSESYRMFLLFYRATIRRVYPFASLLAALLLSSVAAADGVWRVDVRNCDEAGGEEVSEGEGGADGLDGMSWGTAFCEIQVAVDTAHDAGGGEVWIAGGVYELVRQETTPAAGVLLREGVTLMGGFLGNETHPDERDLENVSTIFHLESLINVATGVITLSNTSIKNIHFYSGKIAVDVWNRSENVRIESCVFEGGASGIVTLAVSNLLIQDCTFIDNDRRRYPQGTIQQASGASVQHTTTIRNCTFTDNKGRALRMSGSVLVEDCVFRNNEGDVGGAIAAGGSGGIVRNSIFDNNRALSGGAIRYFGQGISLFIPPPPTEPAFQVINCIFQNNQALFEIEGETIGTRAWGGAINLRRLLDDSPIDDKWAGDSKDGKCLYGGPCDDHVRYSPVLIAGSVFHNNHADEGGAAIGSERVWPVVVNSIEWENGDMPFHIDSPDQFGIRAEDYPSFSYCILSKFPGGIGDENIIGDPLFVDAANGDYRLLPQSPAVDAGRDLSDPLYGAAILDFAGNPRGVPASSSPGGDGSFYDIGAFELASPFHSADRDGSGAVNLSEILRVIQLFNSPGLHCAEVSEDGYAVGVDESAQNCAPHSSDYTPQDWRISLSEVLRAVQIYNTGAYHPCPEGEDGFCVGAV